MTQFVDKKILKEYKFTNYLSTIFSVRQKNQTATDRWLKLLKLFRPAIFSRSGEAQGNAVHASGQASGPNGAFSSTSVSSDSNGKVTYSTKSGKY